MNTSYSLQSNAAELLDICRKRMFGDETTHTEYRDNYVLGNTILAFPLKDYEHLLQFIEADRNCQKIAKSVTLKADAYSRLLELSKLLGRSESETCRLLIFYMAKNNMAKNAATLPKELEEAIVSLKKALTAANEALSLIEKYI